jgi:hypothetical protein
MLARRYVSLLALGLWSWSPACAPNVSSPAVAPAPATATKADSSSSEATPSLPACAPPPDENSRVLLPDPHHRVCPAKRPAAAACTPGDATPLRLERPHLLCRPSVAASIAGRARAQCTIDVDGTLCDCRIVQGIAGADEAVLDALDTMRYTPVCWKGWPQRVPISVPLNMDR